MFLGLVMFLDGVMFLGLPLLPWYGFRGVWSCFLICAGFFVLVVFLGLFLVWSWRCLLMASDMVMFPGLVVGLGSAIANRQGQTTISRYALYVGTISIGSAAAVHMDRRQMWSYPPV